MDDDSGPSEGGATTSNGGVVAALDFPPRGAPSAQDKIIPPHPSLVSNKSPDFRRKIDRADGLPISPGGKNLQYSSSKNRLSIQSFQGAG